MEGVTKPDPVTKPLHTGYSKINERAIRKNRVARHFKDEKKIKNQKKNIFGVSFLN